MFAAYNDQVNQFQKEDNGKTQGNNKVNKIETYHHEQQTYYSYLGIFKFIVISSIHSWFWKPLPYICVDSCHMASLTLAPSNAMHFPKQGFHEWK